MEIGAALLEVVKHIFAFQILMHVIEIAVIALPLLGVYNALLADAPLSTDERKHLVPSFMIVLALLTPCLILFIPIVTGHAGSAVTTTIKIGLGWFAILIVFLIGWFWLRKVRGEEGILKYAFKIVGKFTYHNGIHITFVKYYPIAISALHIIVTVLLVSVMGNSASAGKMNIVGTSAAWILHPLLFIKAVNVAREKLGLKPYKGALELLGLKTKKEN